MILTLASFFHTTEFYVILFIVAIAVVVFAAKPHTAGAVRELLVPGVLRAGVPEVKPSIEVKVMSDGQLIIVRRGLEGLTMAGAVSAKVMIKGFSVKICERIVEGKFPAEEASEAIFMLDALGEERFFIRYESEATQTAASVTMRLVPGANATRDLLK